MVTDRFFIFILTTMKCGVTSINFFSKLKSIFQNNTLIYQGE